MLAPPQLAIEGVVNVRRYLVYLERLNGHALFLGDVEGTPSDLPQKLRARWPRFTSSQRIRLEEAPARG
jgi:hypothetical protein